MGRYKVLCTVPSTIIPRSPFLEHSVNKIASFDFWEREYQIPQDILLQKLRDCDALLTDSALPIGKDIIDSV